MTGMLMEISLNDLYVDPRANKEETLRGCLLALSVAPRHRSKQNMRAK